MKKFFTLLLVALCTMLIASPVAAEDETVYVQYVVDANYDWDFPATYSTDPANPSDIEDVDGGTIGVDGVVIPYGKKLRITVTSTNNWYLVDTAAASHKLAYDASGTLGSFKTNPVIEVAAGTASGSTSVTYEITKENPEIAGTYKDTLTFTSAVVDAA